MKKFISNIEDLKLEVFIVGYSKKGESQIILLKADDHENVILSCVIDCYSESQINKTCEILRENSIEYLDYFIWTHTDEDHSVGIDQIVEEFCKEKTLFYLPEGIYGKEDDIVDYSDDVKASIEKINSLNQRQNYRVNSVSIPLGGHMSIVKNTYIDKNTSIELVFEIIGLAPLSPLWRRKIDAGKLLKKNDISIATLFKVGELGLFFSGDIENQTISKIEDYHFEGLDYIKTPHHTSESSNNLLDKIEKVGIDGNKPSAYTTTYEQHSLPNLDLVKRYKKHVNTFGSTGKGDAGFGYIKTVFDVKSRKIISDNLFGDAVFL